MSHFHFETEVNDLLRLDGPMNKGPAPRWQRKSTEPRCSTTSTSTTPLRSSSRLNCSKTPSKTPKSLKKTPGKAKTPSEDRFIPNRSAMNFEMNYHKMISADRENDENECLSPSKAEFKKKMAQNMGLNDANSRILAFKMKAPTPREGHLNDLRVLYSNSKTPSTSAKKNSRHISPVPERILDAPDLIDDYCKFYAIKLVRCILYFILFVLLSNQIETSTSTLPSPSGKPKHFTIFFAQGVRKLTGRSSWGGEN